MLPGGPRVHLLISADVPGDVLLFSVADNEPTMTPDADVRLTRCTALSNCVMEVRAALVVHMPRA